MFARCKVDAAHELMMRLSAELGDALEPFADQRDIEGAAETTLLTYQANDGSFKRREDRPALLVSGTSWTPDEDFGILLASLRGERAASPSSAQVDALAQCVPLQVSMDTYLYLPADHRGAESNSPLVLRRLFAALASTPANDPLPPCAEYDACKSKDPSAFPSLLCIVTGKGPMRAHFEEVIAREPLRHVRVVTAWLASEDYPRLLGEPSLVSHGRRTALVFSEAPLVSRRGPPPDPLLSDRPSHPRLRRTLCTIAPCSGHMFVRYHRPSPHSQLHTQTHAGKLATTLVSDVGTADVGISLHTSSSGLDLPMKVVDMFGCQLPCCAIGFPCLGELVRHGYNGLIFSGQEELTRHLQRLLGDFPRAEELSMMRSNLRQFRQNGWTQNWDRTAKPVFLQS